MSESRHNQCNICSLHISECVCEASNLNSMDFQYLEDGKWTSVKRSRALELRKEGLEVFEGDLVSYIPKTNPKAPNIVAIYTWAKKVLEAAPLYFWVIPSSSSGKYHPPFSQGEQGLVKHVLAVTYNANQYANTFGLDVIDQALCTAAATIHDLCKYGLSYDPRYFGVHECLVRVKLGRKETGLEKDLPHEWVEKILNAVETHNGNLMTGSWTAFRKPPDNPIAQALHMADYAASRKKFHYEI